MMKQSRMDEVTRTWREQNKRVRTWLENRVDKSPVVVNPIVLKRCDEGNGLIRWECTAGFGGKRKVTYTFQYPTEAEQKAKADELIAAGYAKPHVAPEPGASEVPTGGLLEPASNLHEPPEKK